MTAFGAKSNSLNADVRAGHLGATVVHLANISSRMGRTLNLDPRTEQIVGDEEAALQVGRVYRVKHWSVPMGLA